MSYGISPYGIGLYGGMVADLSISQAVAISTHVVQVTLTKQPQNILKSLPGDVLNPATWSITRGDTGQGFNILEITKVSETVWDIRTLESFASANVFHTVSSSVLLDTGGSVIDVPRSAQFRGLLDASKATPERRAATRNQAIRDYRNPPAPSGLNSLSGTLIIGTDGDYQLEDGQTLVRKLIYRRLTTIPGSFWHLPNYGAGIRVKEPVPATGLIKLRAEIERQVKLEPEVERVRVSLRQSANSLIITVRARLRPTGQQVTFPLQVPFGVQL
jgi:hypothetical protein